MLEVGAMIFPGAQIQRGGHGTCGLLPKRLLSNDKAELHSAGVFTSAGTAPYNFRLTRSPQSKRYGMWPTINTETRPI